ncbi:MAG: HEAT repeat domain-containing protein [Bythopirellula sp.]
MSTTETLVTQLHASDLPTQIGAAETLASLAEEGQAAIVALVQHSGSENEDLRNWCNAALEEIGAPTAAQIDELTLLASSANPDVAFWAATLLGRAGPLASSAMTILQARSDDSSAPAVQRRAAWALQKIQPA